jgi:hypothetical protein
MREEVLRQIHLGARLPDHVELSAETIRLDNAANASALQDVVRHALAPAKVNQMMEDIRLAHEAKLDPDKAVALLKQKFTRDQVEEIGAAFISPDIEMMPQGQTVYRLSNAISWVAQKKAADERMWMEKVAGDLVPMTEKAQVTTV